MMTIKKKKLITIIISTVIILAIAIIVLVILNADGKMFKSQETIVKGYMGQVAERFIKIIDFEYEEQLYKSLDEKIYNSNVEIMVNNEEKGGKIRFIQDSQVDNKDDYEYKYTKLSYGDEIISEVEYLQQDEILGVRFKGLVEQFTSVKNENLKEFVKNIEIFDTKKYAVPEKIEKINIYKNIELSEEEKQVLKEKYIDIIYKAISDKEIVIQEDNIVMVGEQTINANAYIISIERKELNNIFIQILENLKSDEIILGKISNLEKIYGNYVLNKENTLKNYYTDIIEEEIKKITENEEEYKIKFILYEKNDEVIKINIEHELRKINIELQNSNEIKINDLIMGEEENIKQIVISKNDGQLKLDVNSKIGEIENNFLIKENITQKENSIKTEISIIDKAEYEKACYITNNIKIIDEITKKYDIEKNNIILNELDKSNLNKIVNLLTELLSREFIKQIRVLDSGLELNIMGDMVITDDGKTESQKNLFNAKFEFYVGEKISKDNVKSLLEIVKPNLQDIEVIEEKEQGTEQLGKENGEEIENQEEKEVKVKEIRLKIKEDSKYEGSFEELDKLLEKSRDFKVDIEYDSKTELIEYIIIKPNDNK